MVHFCLLSFSLCFAWPVRHVCGVCYFKVSFNCVSSVYTHTGQTNRRVSSSSSLSVGSARQAAWQREFHFAQISRALRRWGRGRCLFTERSLNKVSPTRRQRDIDVDIEIDTQTHRHLLPTDGDTSQQTPCVCVPTICRSPGFVLASLIPSVTIPTHTHNAGQM